jgi:hypothetical protein
MAEIQGLLKFKAGEDLPWAAPGDSVCTHALLLAGGHSTASFAPQPLNCVHLAAPSDETFTTVWFRMTLMPAARCGCASLSSGFGGRAVVTFPGRAA